MSLKTPKEIARTSVDILCDYDSENKPGDIEDTRQRVAEYLYYFTLIITKRLEQAARKEPVD